ncbi:MAG TPA: hypothetical protein VNL70_05535 [Tepidisphaeraceae bacterium]|nr:hypothetical protein [Tepidisphaeraceae bacterium]
MSQINPFTGSILQAPHVQRQQAADKDRQVRKAHDQAKNAALADDRLEHQVESAEELQPIQRDDRRERHFKRSTHKHPPLVDEEDGQPPHIDLTA